MTIARKWAPFAVGLAVLIALSAVIAVYTETDFFTPATFDCYTLQAMRWREGHIKLAENRPWLELAVYEGGYYVSFPPTPTVPMWVLSFIFGENVPAGFVTLCYFLLAYWVLYLLLERFLPRGQAALAAVFIQVAGSLLDMAVSGGGLAGGTWYQAQLFGYLLTLCAFYGLTSEKPRAWALGLIAIALAVGCRPLNAICVPVLMFMLYQRLRPAKDSLWHTLLAMLPYVAVPLMIAAAYGIYNFVRFGNPLEFGHHYLPEYTNSQDPIFTLANLPSNLKNILRPPELRGTAISFPNISGFAVYLTNPLLVFAAGRAIWRAARRRFDLLDATLLITAVVHAAALLTHRTNGGWQFGTRYLCDLLPALALLYAKGREKVTLWEGVPMGALMLFCVVGTVVFHRM